MTLDDVTWSGNPQTLLKAHCVVHALDLRGHGATHTARDEDLSIDTLVHDTLAVIPRLVPSDSEDNEPPQIVLVGHRRVHLWFS